METKQESFPEGFSSKTEYVTEHRQIFTWNLMRKHVPINLTLFLLAPAVQNLI